MKVAIYGAGSLGTVLGAYIAKGGVDIDLITRNQGHVAGLKKNGAQVVGTVNFTQTVSALLPEEMIKKYEIIFLLTKQLDNENVVKGLLPYLAEDGVICTAQNGIPELGIARIIGEERTFGCSVAWGATLLGEGKSELNSAADSLTFSLGGFPNNNTAKLAEIKKLLELMGPVEVEKNFIGARWAKLLVNSAFSGMSAVLGCTFGEVAQDKKSRKCALRIIKECIDVATASGVKIEPIQGKDICKLFNYNNRAKEFLSFLILPLAIKKHRLIKGSMLQDLEKGKKCEVDAIAGIVCESGRKVGVATPYCDQIVEIIHSIEEGQYTSNFGNIRLFKDLK